MHLNTFLSSLNLMTLVIVALALAVALIVFLRRPSNRHPLEDRQDRNVGQDLDAGRDAPVHSKPE